MSYKHTRAMQRLSFVVIIVIVVVVDLDLRLARRLVSVVEDDSDRSRSTSVASRSHAASEKLKALYGLLLLVNRLAAVDSAA